MASVFVTVGTDHHPFDRLVGWVDRWAAAHPEVEVFVQTGTSIAPTHAGGAESLDATDLGRCLAGATVVVSHGGPSTIMEIRAVGLLPVVVPRDPDLGEHVDGHQQAFAREMTALGRIRVPEGEAELGEVLDAAVADPASMRVTDDSADATATVDHIADLVADLLVRHPPRHRRAAR